MKLVMVIVSWILDGGSERRSVYVHLVSVNFFSVGQGGGLLLRYSSTDYIQIQQLEHRSSGMMPSLYCFDGTLLPVSSSYCVDILIHTAAMIGHDTICIHISIYILLIQHLTPPIVIQSHTVARPKSSITAFPITPQHRIPAQHICVY